MSEKVDVKRNIGITTKVVGIICIVLAASLVGSVLIFSSKISSLNSKVSDLNNTANLAKSTYWVENQIVSQPAGAYSSWQFLAQYAGYVAVWIFSNTNNTYVRVIYDTWVHPFHYDNHIDVGNTDTAIFPVLPSSGVEIRVGNTNTINNATETIAHIEYVY